MLDRPEAPWERRLKAINRHLARLDHAGKAERVAFVNGQIESATYSMQQFVAGVEYSADLHVSDFVLLIGHLHQLLEEVKRGG